MTNFKFKNKKKNYTLPDGLPMGSPASPVIANMYMKALEERALSTFELGKPKVWYRYVEHVHVTAHKVHWEAMIIEREQHGRRRKVKEALHIHRMKKRGGSVNQDSGWQLSKIWLDLVQ